MGNSNNKVAPAPDDAGCCSSPVICTAHFSCSVPVWCCGTDCCSEPKVQPVSERNPRSSAAAQGDPGGQPEAAADSAGRGLEALDGDVKPAASPAASAAAVNPDTRIETSATNGPDAPQSIRKDKDGVDVLSEGEKSGSPCQSRHPTNTSEPQPADGDAVKQEAMAGSPARASQQEEELDEEVEELEAFTFDPEAVVALEQFGLSEAAETLADHSVGRLAVQEILLSCLHALDAGAASYNCRRLLAQIKRIADFLAGALEHGGRRRLVRQVLVELQPILQRTQTTFGSWCRKGHVHEFFSGREADNAFLHLHLQLKDCCQGAVFSKLVSALPAWPLHQPPSHASSDVQSGPSQAAASSGEEEGAAPPRSSPPIGNQFLDEPGGYASVEGSRESFDRLLLLFILRYKPSKMRSQKQRLMDLLYTYNTMAGSLEDKLENLVRNRLDKTAPAVLPLLESIMTNMWGAREIPESRVGKWRLAVRLALEPIMVATGEWQLPQTPEEGVEPFTD